MAYEAIRVIVLSSLAVTLRAQAPRSLAYLDSVTPGGEKIRTCVNYDVFQKYPYNNTIKIQVNPIEPMEIVPEPLCQAVTLAENDVYYAAGVDPDRCSLTTQGQEAERSKAAGVLFVADEALYPLFEGFTPLLVNHTLSNSSLLYTTSKSYEALLKAHSSSHTPNRPVVISAEMKLPPEDLPFATFFCQLLLALSCILVGAGWSGIMRIQHFVTEQTARIRAEAAGEPLPEQHQQKFTWVSAVVCLVVMVSALLLLYYFRQYLVWIVICWFVIVSAWAMYDFLVFFANKLPGFLAVKLPFTPASLSTRVCCCQRPVWPLQSTEALYPARFFIYCGCLALCIVWAVMRNEWWSFVLQDIMGFFLCVYLLKMMRIPNLKILTIILTVIIVYDVFFVYITPYITNLPLLFQIPRVYQTMSDCLGYVRDTSYTVLGYGDVIFPGLLVAYCHAFDIAWHLRFRPYFAISCIGYVIGLLATYGVLVAMNSGQPALLFLAPATLIPVHLVALCRGDWHNLWLGLFPIPSIDAQKLPDEEAMPDSEQPALTNGASAGAGANGAAAAGANGAVAASHVTVE